MEQHPITPPPKLAARWVNEIYGDDGFGFDVPLHPITLRLVERAAQWGADQELEACLGKVSFFNSQALADRIRAVRRPKPPSLKEQALQALAEAVKMADDVPPEGICSDQADIIRRALEALPE